VNEHELVHLNSADGDLGVNRFHPGSLSTEDGDGVRKFADFGFSLLDCLGHRSSSTETMLPRSDGGITVFDGDTFRQETRRVEDVVREECEVGKRDGISDHPVKEMRTSTALVR
jgi:hypothetical protein